MNKQYFSDMAESMMKATSDQEIILIFSEFRAFVLTMNANDPKGVASDLHEFMVRHPHAFRLLAQARKNVGSLTFNKLQEKKKNAFQKFAAWCTNWFVVVPRAAVLRLVRRSR